jgi:hypothetical protein
MVAINWPYAPALTAGRAAILRNNAMQSKHRQLVLDLRRLFPQPVSDPVHDGYVAFSVLRALDQVDKLKSLSPILGQPTTPGLQGAARSQFPEPCQTIEDVVPELVGYLDGMFNWGHPRTPSKRRGAPPAPWRRSRTCSCSAARECRS